MEEENTTNLQKAYNIINYFFFIFNIIIILILKLLIKSNYPNIKKLKFKFYCAIIIDSISLFLFRYIKFLYPLFIDLIFSCLSSLLFLIFLSFIYQLFNTANISKLAKKIDFINQFQLSAFFLLVIFPYHKYIPIFTNIIYILENLIILCFASLLFYYFRSKISTININLVSRDILYKKIFFYLKKSGIIIYLLSLFYFVIKIICKYSPEIYEEYLEITLYIINTGGKYIILYVLFLTLFDLDKKVYGNNNEETSRIVVAQNIN